VGQYVDEEHNIKKWCDDHNVIFESYSPLSGWPYLLKAANDPLGISSKYVTLNFQTCDLLSMFSETNR
jgi:hypothetical protein